MSGITVRRIQFELPEDLPTVFIQGEPEESFAQIALSLVLPYLEPYLIKTMKEAAPKVRDPLLAQQLEAFIAQEGQHYQQHRRFNELFRGRGYEALTDIEARMAEDYRRFQVERSFAFNLGYAEGFEALTGVFSVHLLTKRDTSTWHPAALELFRWHLVEELEHRCVAFDVHRHLVGSYFQRVQVGWFAQQHLLKFMARVIRSMIAASPQIVEEHGGPAASESRLKQMERRMQREFLPKVLASHLPWYSPRRLKMPDELTELSRHYSEMASHVEASVPF